uniref:Aldo-keto reductase family 1 member B15 n=1 Tax=Sarcoptes scabiei TaxID=52283 RepID=A0A834VGY2_SARSC
MTFFAFRTNLGWILLICMVSLIGTDRFSAFAKSLNSENDFSLIVNHPESNGKTSKRMVMNNGECLPLIALGTWQLGDDETVKRAIRTAIEDGYRLIDTAYIYGNEEFIGEILQELFKSKQIKREDLFITTKVWNNHFSRESVLKSIENSLRKLKLNYLDLVLLHYPTGFIENQGDYPKYQNGSIIPRTWQRNGFLESWQGMEQAVRNRLTKSIGVSNFNRRQIRSLLSRATIRPVLNQVENHPNLKQEKLRRYLMANQILLQAYAPIRRADKDLLSNPILVEIGKKHGKSSAQVALRWQLDRKVPIVVKSSNPKRIKSNIELFDFQLDQEDMNKIYSIEEKARIYDIPGLKGHPDYPFDSE